MESQVESASVVPIGINLREACHDDYSLNGLQRGRRDKLGNKILEILWLSPDYAIYLTHLGVFIHFSDDKAVEKRQRADFTAICPELCELRYLTSQTRPETRSWQRSRKRVGDDEEAEASQSLFDHNIAQSLMLLMEGKTEDARAIATAALDMAVARVTNDNKIRYLREALVTALVLVAGVGAAHWLLQYDPIIGIAKESGLFLVACFYGIVGATLSIISRVQSFDMKPSQQSNMNKWMARMRVLIGLIGGFALYLLATSSLGSSLINGSLLQEWRGAALIGFIGGFAERLVQSLFLRTAAGIEGKAGTPVQRARTTGRPPIPAAPRPASPTGIITGAA